MSNTRVVRSPGVFALDATTTIPPSPIAGVAYRNPAIPASLVHAGWPFAVKVDSASFNQIMYQLTSLATLVDGMGVLGWNNTVSYGVPAIVFGSDNILYVSMRPNVNADPVASPSDWAPLGSTLRSDDVGKIAFFGTTTPRGRWLPMNGAQNISRTLYADLFSVVGTSMGAGNGTTTFGVGDIRGEFIRGLDQGRGVDPGRTLASFQGQDVQPHIHTTSIPLVQHTASTANYGVTDGPGSAPAQSYDTSANAGSETRPRNVAYPFFIGY